MEQPKEKKVPTIKSPVWQFKLLEIWIKETLISQVTSKGNVACEFNCGSGENLSRWTRVKISQFFGIEFEESKIKEIQIKAEKKLPTIECSFLRASTIQDDLNLLLKRETQFDVIGCFSGLSDAFESERNVRKFIQNVSSRLKPGGFFFGTMPDSAAIWIKAQKRGDTAQSVKETLYHLSFENENFDFFGCKYTLKVQFEVGHNELDSTYLVHFPSLIDICREFQLEMADGSNFLNFYDEHKNNYSESVKKVQSPLQADQRELMNLYTTFCFRKN